MHQFVVFVYLSGFRVLVNVVFTLFVVALFLLSYSLSFDLNFHKHISSPPPRLAIILLAVFVTFFSPAVTFCIVLLYALRFFLSPSCPQLGVIFLVDIVFSFFTLLLHLFLFLFLFFPLLFFSFTGVGVASTPGLVPSARFCCHHYFVFFFYI